MSEYSRRIQAELMQRMRVRHIGEEDNHVQIFACDSFSRGKSVVHEIRWDVLNDGAECSCEYFQYKLRTKCPSWERGPWCRHIRFLQQVLKGDEYNEETEVKDGQ